MGANSKLDHIDSVVFFLYFMNNWFLRVLSNLPISFLILFNSFPFDGSYLFHLIYSHVSSAILSFPKSKYSKLLGFITIPIVDIKHVTRQKSMKKKITVITMSVQI